MYPRKIKNFNVFVDGFGYAGLATATTLPQLALQTEDYRGAGMDGPIEIDMGVQKLELEITFAEFREELVSQFGNRLRGTIRAAATGERDFAADAWSFIFEGRVKGLPMDDLGAGKETMLKQAWTLHYFAAEKDGKQLVEIDVEAGTRVIGGVDQTAGLRAALAL